MHLIQYRKNNEGLRAFLRYFSSALDQMTRQYSKCDRTSDLIISIITEDGTYADHFLERAMPFPIFETMYSVLLVTLDGSPVTAQLQIFPNERHAMPCLQSNWQRLNVRWLVF